VLRPVGVYPFLGTLPQRLLAGEAQDGTGSLLNRAVQKISDWCRRKLWGHHAYYGITGNGEALSSFKYAVEQHETRSRVYSGVVKE
jgi:hypothetical protein